MPPINVSVPKPLTGNLFISQIVTQSAQAATSLTRCWRSSVLDDPTLAHGGVIPSPKLWSPKTPDLYNVHAEVWADGVAKDLVNEHTGFRSYELTSNDFILNGVSTRLRGVSKHQETEWDTTEHD